MTEKKAVRVWLESVPAPTSSFEVQRRRDLIWHEQFRRVLRALTRLEDTERPREEYVDDLVFFFQSCWHLRDWIINDDILPEAIRDRVNDDIKSWPALLVCRDLATASKHLDGWPRGDRKAVLGTVKKTSSRTIIGGGRAEPETEVTETVADVVMEFPVAAERWPEGTHDSSEVTHKLAVDVAREATEAWRVILIGYGLLNEDGDPVLPAPQ